MASFPYYRWFPGDYLADTIHLGWLEDLAYRRLLDHYQLHNRPIPNDRAYIMRIVRANEPEQQAAVDTVLAEFFNLSTDGWHQKRSDRELRYRKSLSEAGKFAVTCRENKKLQSTDNRSIVDRSSNQNQNHIKTKTTPPPPLPSWLDKQAWDQFVEHRKKLRAPLTPGACMLIWQKLEKDQGNHKAMLEQAIERGWKGVFPLKLDTEAGVAWWSTDGAMLAKAAELGVSTRGLMPEQLKARIREAIEKRKQEIK